MKKEITRQHLLDSAAKLVDREGGSRLTLDAVAQEAAVSKGCLLYHFATKNALIEGMVEYLILRFEADLAAHLEHETGPGRWIRAYIQASFPHDTFLGRVSAGVFAAIASEPDMLRMARERFLQWQRRLEQDGIDPIDATIARLATDGLWFSGALGFAPPEANMREAVVQRLTQMMSPH
jgi:AcrR family transcriptional regulator